MGGWPEDIDMRTFHFIGPAVVVLLGAGATSFGCSSSPSPAPGTTAGNEAGTAEPTDANSVDDATQPVNEAAAPNPCANAAIPNVETFAATGSWPCFQVACKTSLTACAADMCCNAGISAALVCSSNQNAQTCFTTAFTTPPLAGTPTAMAVEDCLFGALDAGTCSATVRDAGASPADAADASGEQ
jgi:hypothetical protein